MSFIDPLVASLGPLTKLSRREPQGNLLLGRCYTVAAMANVAMDTGPQESHSFAYAHVYMCVHDWT